jgi:hypothetical protein
MILDRVQANVGVAGADAVAAAGQARPALAAGALERAGR